MFVGFGLGTHIFDRLIASFAFPQELVGIAPIAIGLIVILLEFGFCDWNFAFETNKMFGVVFFFESD